MRRTIISIALFMAVFAAGFWVGRYQREPSVDQAARIQQPSFNLVFSPTCSKGMSRKQCEESIGRELERTQERLTRWVYN